jgi:hypothetical protein
MPLQFSKFCRGKQCEFLDFRKEIVDSGVASYQYLKHYYSCTKMGQSEDITEYPSDCIHLKDIQRYEKKLILIDKVKI